MSRPTSVSLGPDGLGSLQETEEEDLCGLPTVGVGCNPTSISESGKASLLRIEGRFLFLKVLTVGHLRDPTHLFLYLSQGLVLTTTPKTERTQDDAAASIWKLTN